MSDSDTGRVPPGAALDQLIAKWRHAAELVQSSTGAKRIERARAATQMRCADELERLRAALDARPPQAPQEQEMTTDGETHCQHCGVDIRLMDGEWLDRETHATCEPSQKHAPPVAERRRAQEHPK